MRPIPAQADSGDISFDIEVLRGEIAQVLDVTSGEIEDDANLVTLGLDSVKMMAMSARLRRYGVRLRFAHMVEQPTVAGWWRLTSGA
ncbi:phosphopantetheine-binding protein [Actinomadura sp. DC4]|uniref:phosphopantetheine-binding protein n=1 Tax=Actinomadura sp. DC4 TaxID=3055069 RepID=UPI0025B0B985|nr:phosphopantetheine-binding protein [Actinomadura sp. DC4]MDN3356785.1 phosphopantetheine-binding protein [Actinomadura sp. DC4]